MAEDVMLDFQRNSDMAIMILRYFNEIGSDPDGGLGEAPRPELREHGQISGACFDAAHGIIPGLKVRGTDYKTPDGRCIRDYIDVTDLVDAHVKALEKAKPGHVGIYNVSTGRGRSVKEFVEACKKATGVPIKVNFLPGRPGDYAEVYSDPTKIRGELNWTPKHTDLQESLRIAWRWQKAHLDGYGLCEVNAAYICAENSHSGWMTDVNPFYTLPVASSVPERGLRPEGVLYSFTAEYSYISW